ncbi:MULTISPECIES: spondin domain-containing protein [Halorussus]|uniref:spondin domain-containing protein n=1 Tax=Halorussus TaxID=1070314 RepID=UPI00209EBBFE|nr:spondin domain-containing protein [Halorussus vallis]USZ76380.1 spondin domain-containing protein [Halorussus vallis]
MRRRARTTMQPNRTTADGTGETDATNASETTADAATTRRRFLAGSAGAAAAVGLSGLGAGSAVATGDGSDDATTFHIRVENVSGPNTLETSAKGEARKQPVPLSPGAYAVHDEHGPLFTVGEPARDNGLEALAEDGMPGDLAAALSERDGVSDSGAFAAPVGADDPAPIGPGGAYEFTVEAEPGERLSLATMFVQSNDLFYAPEERGIALFDGDEPLSGDVTHAVDLWDAGTECNQEPGVGADQAPRQSESGAGMEENAPVRPITDVGDGYSYPYASEVIRVTREVEMG